jgi:hypothetical protein
MRSGLRENNFKIGEKGELTPSQRVSTAMALQSRDLHSGDLPRLENDVKESVKIV